MSYTTRIVFVDQEENQFVELGRSAFKDREEQMIEWKRIPKSPAETDFLIDLMDASEISIINSEYVTRETIEALLGMPMEELIEDGRKRLEEEHQEFVKQYSTLK